MLDEAREFGEEGGGSLEAEEKTRAAKEDSIASQGVSSNHRS